MADRIKPTDIFADIGADFGFYTCLLGNYLGGDNVIAVESYPPRLVRLRANLRLNFLICHIERRAWGASDDGLTGYTSVFDRVRPDTARGDDAIADGLPEPTVLKIDVDGGEYEVISGLRETLVESTRLVYVEIHPSHLDAYNHTADDVEQELVEAGFELTRQFEQAEHNVENTVTLGDES